MRLAVTEHPFLPWLVREDDRFTPGARRFQLEQDAFLGICKGIVEEKIAVGVVMHIGCTGDDSPFHGSCARNREECIVLP